MIVEVPQQTHDLDLEISDGRSVSKAKIGSTVTLCGYLQDRRTLSKELHFWTLRSRGDRTSIQIVGAAFGKNKLRQLGKGPTPAVVTGIRRQIKTPKDPQQDVEIHALDIIPLNQISEKVVLSQDHVYPASQRHLQLRYKPQLRQDIIRRSLIYGYCRDALKQFCGGQYVETETPLLFKSTPEGAHEFIVPTRRKGFAYALPQSPQQFKQTLMASGITAYFQFARCFRDEDLRADRQPEFTQLDMEKSFANGAEIMNDTEKLIRHVWSRIDHTTLPTSFPRISFHDAMKFYGTDKPDMRFSIRNVKIDHMLPAAFVSKISPLKDPIVEAAILKTSENPANTKKLVRAALSEFLDSPVAASFHDNAHGGPAVMFYDSSRPLCGLSALEFEAVQEIESLLSPRDGDVLVFQARPRASVLENSTPLGNLRAALQEFALKRDLIIPEKRWAPLWVVDFPLFTPTTSSSPGQGGAAGLSSTHHPFTSPKTAADVDYLRKDPTKVIADHYDLVINGAELGGGSRRIHDPNLQSYILKDVLKMSNEKLAHFAHLIEVLESGCPPHAGIALGMDRLVAMLLGRDSIRDVIAFPKTGKGEDPLMKSPGVLDEETLERYHLQLRNNGE